MLAGARVQEALLPEKSDVTASIVQRKATKKWVIQSRSMCALRSRVHCRSAASVRSISSEWGAFAFHGPSMGPEKNASERQRAKIQDRRDASLVRVVLTLIDKNGILTKPLEEPTTLAKLPLKRMST